MATAWRQPLRRVWYMCCCDGGLKQPHSGQKAMQAQCCGGEYPWLIYNMTHCKIQRHCKTAAAVSLWKTTSCLGDRSLSILCSRVRGFIKGIRVVRNTWLFLLETKFVANVSVYILFCRYVSMHLCIYTDLYAKFSNCPTGQPIGKVVHHLVYRLTN